MAGLINVFRSGFKRGFDQAVAGERRRADWELKLLRPLNWIPGVDSTSYLDGYAAGYTDGLRTRIILPRLNE